MISASPTPQETPLSPKKLLASARAFRPVAVQLLRLIGDVTETSSLARIVVLLRSDAVIAAQVLRLANSPLFAARCEISNVLQAVSYLGLDRLRSLVLTAVFRALTEGSSSPMAQLCWRHNLATALICGRLAGSAGLAAERCYIAGLIHDLGCLTMINVYPDYANAIRATELRGVDWLAEEQRLFGIDHAEAGRWLLSRWGCPLELQIVAAQHEDPAGAPVCDRGLVNLVHAGCQLAEKTGLSVFGSRSSLDLSEIAASLPPALSDQVEGGFPELAEWVALKVNAIELSLF